jgi:acyl-CoA thioester hydrolase
MQHEIEVRVYYEDTDFSGRVYHASYLRFLERARTEFLRARGFENSALADERGLVFVVRRLELEFLRPARMDDLLRVSARAAPPKGATAIFEQSVRRDDELLCRGVVELAMLRNGKPARPPRWLQG